MNKRNFLITTATAIAGVSVISLLVAPTVVDNSIKILIHRDGNNLVLDIVGGVEPFQYQIKDNLHTPNWRNLGPPTFSRTKTVPITNSGYFRIKSNLSLLTTDGIENLFWQIPDLN